MAKPMTNNHFKEMQDALNEALLSSNLRMNSPLKMALAAKRGSARIFIVRDNGHVEPLDKENVPYVWIEECSNLKEEYKW